MKNLSCLFYATHIYQQQNARLTGRKVILKLASSILQVLSCFESGDVHERRGRNEPAPGVEAEDGREEWSGGRHNYANESVGATTEACGHPSVEAGAKSGAWQGHAHHFVKSENPIENKRWVGFDITEVKSNSSMVYICIACGGLSLYVCCTSVVAHPFHAGFAGRTKTHVQITDST